MEEQKSHKFLKYEKAIINFVYSFSWDVTQSDFSELEEALKQNKEWHTLFLFNRPVSWAEKKDQASYHPNIVSQNISVLHYSGTIDNKALVVVPISKDKNGQLFNTIRYKKVFAKLNFALRLYENGAGNCTFTFILDAPNFFNIHSVIRLASSISFNENDKETKDENQKHNTHSFLRGSTNANKFLLKDKDKISLTELFSRVIDSQIMPTVWKEKALWFDKKVIKKNKHDFKTWQTPYIHTILEIDKTDFKNFEDNQDKNTVKELGSFIARFSTDNSTINTEFFKLKREYIFNSLGFYACYNDDEKKDGIRLKNYSHHSDLFYTIGKRGALAITPNLKSNPSYFAIPTLLNLVEILRSRWHLGSIVNLKLDDTLQLISRSKPGELENILDDVFLCRALYGFFLQNPAPYLFDGGAITEIAEAGEETFWLKKLTVDTERKFGVLEKLLRDQLERKRLTSLLEYYQTPKANS
ncbi:MAG: hypothetical protein HZA79_04490 [Sphingobacteriales bacterium]|nr:hypothetical protein [Sphingobacteriales bacterium]